MRMRSCLAVALMSLASVGVEAQQTPAQPAKSEPAVSAENTAPTLSEVDKLKLENLLLKYQLQLASMEATKTSLGSLIASLQRPGWTFDVQSLTYVKEK